MENTDYWVTLYADAPGYQIGVLYVLYVMDCIIPDYTKDPNKIFIVGKDVDYKNPHIGFRVRTLSGFDFTVPFSLKLGANIGYCGQFPNYIDDIQHTIVTAPY